MTRTRKQNHSQKPSAGRLGWALVALALWLPTAVLFAGTCDLTVGPDVGCDHPTLNGAVGAAAFTSGPETICVAQNHSEPNTSLTLSNFDNPTPGSGSGPLVIDGGFATCGSAASNGSRAEVTGGAAAPVFEVTASAGRESIVTLRRLRILEGSNGLVADGAGVAVLVKNTRLESNGRGIDLSNGSEVTVDLDSSVIGNDGAAEGAGIRCNGSDLTIAGQVYQNDGAAGSDGGGLFADSCSLDLQDGAWFFLNSAEDGGGLYLTDTVVEGGGTGTFSVRIFDNDAARGGGLFAGPFADVLLGNVQIFDNTVTVKGGGISILDGFVQIERFNFLGCLAPPRCTFLRGNYAPVQGAAVHVEGSGEFRMYQGFIEGNETAGAGSLIRVVSSESSALLDGVQIFGNRARFPLDAQRGDITAGFTTVAGNSWENSNGLILDSNGAKIDDSGSIRIYSSIWADHEEFTALSGTLRADCLLAETAEGLGSHTRSLFGPFDPGFVDEPSGDLHLRPDSIAIDYCDTSEYVPADADYDVHARGRDVAPADVYGPYDLGADEALTGIEPPIFTDGFESGDTTAWSDSLP